MSKRSERMSKRGERPMDGDDVRALFQQVQPPPGVARWREVNEARELRDQYPISPASQPRRDSRGPAAVPLGPPERARRRPANGGRLRPPRRRSLAMVATALAILVVSGAIPSAIHQLLRVTEAATGAAPAPARPSPSPSVSAAPSASPSAAPASSAPPSAAPPSATAVPGAAPWPTAQTTGVPAGTTLKTHSGGLTITKAGTILDAILVTGTVTVQAPNVTIRRSRIAPGTQTYWAVRQLPGATNLMIEDSEIAGGKAQSGISQQASGLTVRRVSIHDAEKGIDARDSVTVQDSWLYNVGSGLSDQGGVSAITIAHNVITGTRGGEAAIALYNNAGPVSAVVIDDNLLAGGNYTLYPGTGNGSHDIRVTRNHFSRSVSPHGGSYGPVETWNGKQSGNTWTANVWDDTNAPVNP